MAFKLLARTREQTGTSGTGAVLVSGLISSDNVKFSDVMSVGDTSFFVLLSGDGTGWEEFFGTYSATNTIQRTTTIINHLGTTAHITLSGTSRIFGIVPSDFALLFAKLGTGDTSKFLSGDGTFRTVSAGGGSIATDSDVLFSGSPPAAGNNDILQFLTSDSKWHNRTPTQVTATLDVVVGDSGSGGTKGLVPAAAVGDAAAGKLLGAGGSFVVPSYIAGWHYPVSFSTTAALPANTYANGSSGVGATLTGNSNGALPSQDGIAPVVGYRLLVKNEATAANNGVYVVTQVGTGGTPYILTRATDFNSASNINQGDVVVVGPNGTLNGSRVFQVVASGSPIVLGTIGFTFVEIPATFVGDSGSGGVRGQVPAPAAGDAAANKVLGAGGGWVTPAGSSGAFGSATTVAATNSSGNIDITGVAVASAYQLVISNLRPATAGASGTLVFGIGSTTWIVANYSWSWHLVDNTSGHAVGGSDSDSSIHLLPAALAAAEIFGASGTYIITNAGDSSHYSISGHHAGRVDYSSVRHGFLGHSGGVATLGGALTGVRLVASSGNWQSGSISLIPLTL